MSELLDVSVPTLLGVGVEYISSAVAFFNSSDRSKNPRNTLSCLRDQYRSCWHRIPFETLEEVLAESIPDGGAEHDRAQDMVRELTPILRRRKDNWRTRKPGI